MPRNVETIVRDYIGDQVLTLAKMTATIEELQQKVAALEAHVALLEGAAAKVPLPPQN